MYTYGYKLVCGAVSYIRHVKSPWSKGAIKSLVSLTLYEDLSIRIIYGIVKTIKKDSQTEGNGPWESKEDRYLRSKKGVGEKTLAGTRTYYR
jgi:hypothetical protein